MVPQGQLAYYTPAAPAPPMYQAPPFQFAQPPHVTCMPSASPASSSEPSMYGHSPHPAPYVGTPASVAPSYPSNTHHANFTHNAGSEHEHVSTSFSEGDTLPCQWQGQDIPPSCSPPPPAYPPGFEPKQNEVSTRCISSSVTVGNPCIPTSHPHPHPHPYPHPHPHPHPHQHPHAHPHPHVNALPQQHPLPPRYLHPTSSPHSNHNSSSQTACHTPMLHPTAQTGHLTMGHGFDVNGTVIGVPVIGTPVYVDGTASSDNPWSTTSPNFAARQQSGKSTFHLTRYFRGNGSHVGSPSKGARNFQQNAWQPSNLQTQRFGVERHSTSSFRDCSQRHVASTVGNLCMDPRFSMESNHQQQVPPRELSFSTNGRQPPNTRRDNQPQSTQHFHFKACPAKETFFPKAQDVHVNGQQKLASYQFSEHKGNLQCEVIRDRPDGQPLRFNACQRSLASACSEAAQLGSDVHCEETACSPNASGELVEEHRLGSVTTLVVDSEASPASIKKREGLNRWLQDRKHKYPTPANIMRKAEERRKREEMGEFVSDKPKFRLQHIKGVLKQCYHRQERSRMDKNMKFQEQCVDYSQCIDNSRDEESTREKNDLADCHHSANGSQMPQAAGQIKSPPLHGEVSELERGIHDAATQSILTSDEIFKQTNIEQPPGFGNAFPIKSPPLSDSEIHDAASQSILTSDEIFKQIDIEKPPGPGNAFLFRRKRRKQQCDRSTSSAQRQKQLLFKILDRDIEKESSYLLQCCRFFVNNHYLQGFSPSNVKHFKWVGAGKPSSVNGSSTHGTHTTDVPACARQNEMSTSGAESARDTQALVNDEGKERPLGEDNCQDLSEPSLASVENPFDDNVSVEDAQHASALPPQELSCSHKEQELIEDAEQELIEDTEHVSALPLQEPSSSDKEQDLIADEEYNVAGSQLCQKHVGMGQLEFNATSGVDRFVNGSHHEKEAPFPWKHLDGYHYQKITSSGLAARHYDCIRESYCANGLIPDSKHAPLLHSSSNLDAQGLAPFLWEQLNTDSRLPNHEMDIGELGSGIDNNILNDDEDILQYMNFDAFETDSGICYV